MVWLWVGIGIAVLLALVVIAIYNGFIRLRNEIENSFAQIDVQLKRRNDLIPNLIETVKGYAKHEKTILENVTKARTDVMKATTPQRKAEASNMLSDTLKSLFAVAENYPQLRANENFMQLQEELTATEDKIAYSRQHYNDVVMQYNAKLETVPSNIVGNMFSFKRKELFQTPEAERKPVKVQF